MTTTTETRNPAAAVLQSLARCTKVQPFQAGDEDFVCGNDMIPLVPMRGHFEHDPKYIARLRAMTYDERWPR